MKPFGIIRSTLTEALFNTILADKETGYESVNKLHDSTFSILMIWALERCHNNIYLAQLSHVIKIFFKYANETTLLNSIIKTNVMSDLANFFSDHVFGWGEIAKISDVYLFFFKDLIKAIIDSFERNTCVRFKEEISRSHSWKYLLDLYK